MKHPGADVANFYATPAALRDHAVQWMKSDERINDAAPRRTAKGDLTWGNEYEIMWTSYDAGVELGIAASNRAEKQG